MKFVKFSVFALSMAIVVASCGNGAGEAPKTDSAAATTAPAAETTPPPAAAPVDTTNAGAAKMDTAAKAGETKMEKKETKTTETKMETKKK